MSRNAHDLIYAPTGMNNTDLPTTLNEATGQNLVNFLADRKGKLRGQVRARNLTFTSALSTNIYGLGFLPQQIVTYTSGPTPSTPAVARLAVNNGTQLTSYALNSPANAGILTFPPTFSGPGATIGVPSNLRTRFAAFQTELYGVQEQNNIVNYRMLNDGTWYGLGVFPSDLAVPFTGSLVTPGGPYLKEGNVQYMWTVEDNLGRESSPSAVITLSFGGAHASEAHLDWGATLWTGNAEWVTFNIYATTGAGQVFYRITQITNKATTTYNDNANDATVSAGVVAPNFGQNDQPLPASIIVAHKNRVVMNVNNDANSIQVSNYGSATQFSTTGIDLAGNGQVKNPNDGITFRISGDIGNDITGLASHGTVLAIGRQRSTWVLFGDDITDFIPRKVSDHGNMSPDAMIRCDNEVIFLSQDGVYTLDGQFNVTKISGEIEATFQSMMGLPTSSGTHPNTGDMLTAVAYFVQRHYVLCIYDKQYAFNVDTRRWVTFDFGIVSPSSAVVAMPPNSPQLAILGRVDGSGANRTALIDLISGRDNVSGGVATTSMTYRTRVVTTQLPYHLRATIGEQEARSAKKRQKRIRIFGAGTNISGSVIITVDGRTETYTTPNPVSSEQVLWLQEFTAAMTGRVADITLSGWAGTGVEINEILCEDVFVG